MQALAALKKLLANSSQLSNILNLFFDVVENENLMIRQKLVNFRQLKKDHNLHKVFHSLEKITTHWISVPLQIIQPFLYEVAEDYFFHGFCMTNNSQMPVTLFYFDDIKVGVFAFLEFGNANKPKIFRFSIAECNEKNRLH